MGEPIRVEIRRSLGSHLAGASIPRRLILLDAAVFARRGEFERILIHELFHFVWLRAGNPRRRSWESLLKAELAVHARGELGWSAEWRKKTLRAGDIAGRTRRWREYCCESFCDTAAWLYSDVRRHPEFALAAQFRAPRRIWFGEAIGKRELPV